MRARKLLFIFLQAFVFTPALYDYAHVDCAYADARKELAGVNSVFIASIRGGNSLVLSKILRETAQEELAFEVKVPKNDADCEAFQAVGADACIYVEIDDYTELNGSSLSASNGASVDFTVHLSQGGARDIWSSRFTFKDTPLSENIIKFGENVADKGGTASFTTARAQFEKGIRDTLRKLNDDRTKQFLKQ